MRRLRYLVPLAAFASLALLFYGLLSGPPPATIPSPLLNRPAPDFRLPPLDAQARGFGRQDLASGHMSVVNFWASWCAPCRVEHPILAALAGERSVKVYGIAYKNEAAAARAYLRELGDPFAAINADRDGRAAIDWGVTGVPETFLVDGDGVVRARFSGPLTPATLSNVILPALRAHPQARS